MPSSWTVFEVHSNNLDPEWLSGRKDHIRTRLAIEDEPTSLFRSAS